MRKFFFLLVLLLAQMALAAGGWVVNLSDGSRLRGTVEGLSGGVYLIRTPDAGLLRIPEGRVVSLQREEEPAPPPSRTPSPRADRPSPSPAVSAGAGEMAERILSDQDILNLVMALADSPAFQEVLKDPRLMEAVDSGDVAFLLADPRFKRLLTLPQVQEIEGRLSGSP